MDVAYFLRQFSYDTWANTATIASITQLSDHESENARRLFGHILSGQKIWLMRLIGEEIPPETEVFPTYSIEDCLRMCEEFNEFWREYLGNITKLEISYPIQYKTTTGIQFVNSVQDIVSHVITHSAYHRAQIAIIVRTQDKIPAITDFISFAREHPIKKLS